MAIWLDPESGQFSTDGNWSSTTVNEDGSKTHKEVRNGKIVSEVTEPPQDK